MNIIHQKKNQLGFSLVELMIVVTIIGLLATLGQSSYSAFKARARQSEAKSRLSLLYSGESAFYAEWNTYSVNLKLIGFAFVKKAKSHRYDVGFPGVTSCASYPSTAPSEGPGYNLFSLTDFCNGGICDNSGATCATDAGCPPMLFQQGVPDDSLAKTAVAIRCGSPTSVNPGFIATAFGDPRDDFTANGGGDVWTIDDKKNISNSLYLIK